MAKSKSPQFPSVNAWTLTFWRENRDLQPHIWSSIMMRYAEDWYKKCWLGREYMFYDLRCINICEVSFDATTSVYPVWSLGLLASDWLRYLSRIDITIKMNPGLLESATKYIPLIFSCITCLVFVHLCWPLQPNTSWKKYYRTSMKARRWGRHPMITAFCGQVLSIYRAIGLLFIVPITTQNCERHRKVVKI